tara:strand:+ start:235 stop:1674 length:1440 start_codon:yes stop_codon:yes gene_type:complete
MSTTFDILKQIAQNQMGASGTSTNDLTGGALQNLILQQIQNTQRNPERDKYLALLEGFSTLGEKASQPGATALGAGFAGLRQGVKSMLQSQARDEKRDLQNITLLSSIQKLGNVARKPFELQKDDQAFAQFGGTKKYDVIYLSNSELNALPPAQRTNILPYVKPETKTTFNNLGEEIYLTGKLKGTKVLDDTGTTTADMYKDKLNIDTTEQNVVVDNDNVTGTVQKGFEVTQEQLKALPPMNKLQSENFFKVQNNYNKDKFVARYNEILPNIENIITAYDKAYTLDKPGAADISLIFSYMKMLDPRSVVREGEFLVARQTGGPADFLLSYLNRLKDGSILTDGVRRSFRDMAIGLYDNASKNLKTSNQRVLNQITGVFKIPEGYGKSILINPVDFESKVRANNFKVRLPKTLSKDTFKEMFVNQNATLDDITYMLKADNVKNNNQVKSIISEILDEVKENKFKLVPIPNNLNPVKIKNK